MSTRYTLNKIISKRRFDKFHCLWRGIPIKSPDTSANFGGGAGESRSNNFIFSQMDGRIHFGKSVMTGGGVARNICEALSKLGCRPVFISVLGNDPQGNILKNFIPQDNLERVKVLDGHSTGQCTIVLDRNGECKFLAGDMDIHQQITPEMVRSFC